MVVGNNDERGINGRAAAYCRFTDGKRSIMNRSDIYLPEQAWAVEAVEFAQSSSRYPHFTVKCLLAIILRLYPSYLLNPGPRVGH